jgi:hypothetical protein
MIAAKYGHVETAKLLIERYNANIYIQNIEQSNVSQFCIVNNRLLMSQLNTIRLEYFSICSSLIKSKHKIIIPLLLFRFSLIRL